VLSPDVELVDLDGRHLANWLTLFVPPGLDRSFRVAIAFVDRGALVRAIVVGEGIVELPWHGIAQRDLAAARHAAGAGALLAIDTAALPAVFGDLDGALRSEHDYAEAGTLIWTAVKRAASRGLLHMDPPLLDVLPAPGFEPLQRTFDRLIPDGSALVAYVLEDDGSDVHASIIASKDGGDIVFATTHMAIADEIGAKYLARDWRKRYGRVLEIVESRYDPPAVGVFLERSVVERIMTGPVDQLMREVADRNIIFDPSPLWLSALLGGAAVAATGARAARGVSKLIPKSARKLMGDVARQAGRQLEQSGLDPWELLGFNPIETWLELRKLFLRTARTPASAPR
jgi:hypothetical protein